jgi:nucleoside phosphorylase
MKTTDIALFVFDTKANFENSKQFLGEEDTSFKRIICVDSMTEFKQKFDNLSDEEHVFLVVHVFYTDGISGLKKFKASRIDKTYPGLNLMFISDGDDSKIRKEMIDAKIPDQEIYKYHEVQSQLEEELHKSLTKKDILKLSTQDIAAVKTVQTKETPHFDYAVVTALYDEEFEELKLIFDFPTSEIIKTKKKLYQVGYLKGNKDKKIIAAFQNATGMVDAAVIATQMIEFFTPKYIIMTGVCGGAPDKNLGDIIIASQIYALQKGKLSDIFHLDEHNKKQKIDLFDKIGNKLDLSKIYDNDGHHVIIGVEKFERDIDALIELDSATSDTLKMSLKNIVTSINNTIKEDNFFHDKVVKASIEPMACSTMVINKEGYFEQNIKSIIRGTAAVEMESYGVARASQFANDGLTIPIIFKSVMDNTSKKEDIVDGINYKKFAAYTSALFLRFLLESNAI